MAVAGKALLKITAIDMYGNPYPNVSISGITGIDAEHCITDSNGTLMLGVDEGSYTIRIDYGATPIDVKSSVRTIQVSTSTSNVANLVESSALTNGIARLTKSGSYVFSRHVKTADLFVVGGGAGGSDYTGGGGGYTKTLLNATVSNASKYNVTIGKGGSYNSYGGRTSFGTLLQADGGCTGYYSSSSNNAGGAGGSGGGAYAGSSSINGVTGLKAGSDGGDGETYDNNTGGKGQGTTTRAFGEPDGELFAGGGGGQGVKYYSPRGDIIWYLGKGGDGGGATGAYITANNSPSTDYPATTPKPNSGSGGGAGLEPTANPSMAASAGADGICLVRPHY